MSPRVYTRRYLVTLVTLLMLVATVNTADKELLAPVADAVRADLGMSDTQLGAVRSAVFLAALLGQFLWGPLSDRWVRKYVIAIGAVLWSTVIWLTAFVVSFPQLLLARASMSFFEGCFNPSAWSLVTDTFPKRRHGLVLGLMSLTYPVGTATALIVASLIGAEQWRQPFVIYGVIGIVLGLLVLAIVKEPARGAMEESVQEAGGLYTGRFSLAEFRRVLVVPSVLLVFALDACQAAVKRNVYVASNSCMSCAKLRQPPVQYWTAVPLAEWTCPVWNVTVGLTATFWLFNCWRHWRRSWRSCGVWQNERSGAGLVRDGVMQWVIDSFLAWWPEAAEGTQ